MRKFALQTSPSLYSAGLEDAEIEVADDPILDGINAEETREEIAEADEAIEVAEGLEARACGLEDLAEVIESNPEGSTATEIQLVDVAQDMASVGVDGMDIPETFEGATTDEDGVASMESLIGRKLSTEGIKAKIKEIYENIMALVAKAWDKILEIWRRLTDQAKAVTKRARKLREAADAKSGGKLKDGDKEIKLGGLANTLQVDNSAPNKPGDLLDGLETTRKVADQVLADLASTTVEVGPKLAAALKAVPVEKQSFIDAAKDLGKVNTVGSAYTNKAKSLFSTNLTGDDYKAEGFSFGRSDHLPGNRMVVSKVYSGKETDNLSVARGIRGSSVFMAASNDKPKSHKDTKMKPLTPAEVDKVCTKVENVAAVVANYQAKHLRTLEKQRNMLKDATKAISSKIPDDASFEISRLFNVMAGFNLTYANWCRAPFGSMASHALTTCRAAMSVGDKSLARYEA